MNKSKASTTKSRYFPHYNDGVLRLNVGSLGAVVGSALAAQHQFREWFLTDTGPSRYHFTGRLGPEILESLKEVVSMFQEFDEVPEWDKRWSFVQNATTAAAIVAHHWHKEIYVGDDQHKSLLAGRTFLITTDCIFGPIRRCFEEHMQGVELVELKLLSDKKGRSIPQSKSEILRRFNDELTLATSKIHELSHGNDIRLFCCLEYIPCVPAIKLPVPDMVSKIRQVFPGAKVFVDAAQLFLEQGMSLASLVGNPEFIVVNLYKWNFAPIGASILYVGEENVSHVIPSWAGPLSQTGWYSGLGDYSAYISAKQAIQVRITVPWSGAISQAGWYFRLRDYRA